MEAAPPRFNKLRRASGPTEVKTSSIRFYPASYRRVGCALWNQSSFKSRNLFRRDFAYNFNRKIYCQIKTRFKAAIKVLLKPVINTNGNELSISLLKLIGFHLNCLHVANR